MREFTLGRRRADDPLRPRRADEAVDALGGPGYTLLTTERAAAAAPRDRRGRGRGALVGRGQVDELAGDLLRRRSSGDRLVALGGGRVVDVAKALAAARRTAGAPARWRDGPTTLSGAEMTRGHRHARGVDESTPRVRPAVVVFDPALAASQPVPELAASSLNALGHAVEGAVHGAREPGRDARRPRGRAAARARAGPAREPDRETLALGALLAGYVIDSTGLGLHHVLAQTLVRVRRRGARPGQRGDAAAHDRRARAARVRSRDRGARRRRARSGLVALARRLARAAGARSLASSASTPRGLPEGADAAAARPQLANTPPRRRPRRDPRALRSRSKREFGYRV